MNNFNKKTAVQSAQLRQLFSASNASLVTSVFLAAILAYMQHDVIDSTVVYTWFSLVVLVLLSRAALVIAYRYSPVDVAVTHVWLARFRLGVLVTGVIWGSAGFLLFPADHPQHQMFLIVILAGLTAGGVASYSVDLVSAIVFSMLVTVPLAVRLFVAGDSLSMAMGMAVTLYLGFMLINFRHINRSTCENIILRLEAAAREETVRASEERYRLLLSHSPVGIFHYDTNLVITYCNNRFADMMLNSIERIIGVDTQLLKDQASLPVLRKALEGEMGHYEGHYRATFSDIDGWVDMTCAPFLDDRGNIVGGIAIVQDVTERHNNQQRIEQLLDEQRIILENQLVGIATVRDRKIVWANPAFETMHGYDKGEVVGAPTRQFYVNEEDYQAVGVAYANIENNGIVRTQHEFLRKDGQKIWLDMSGTILSKETGKSLWVFVDVTERKQAADEIEHLAFYDPLTRLPNRRLLLDRLKRALAASTRNGRGGALLFLDLDHFKTLNDTLGHAIGDLLLQQVAERLTACLRESDTIARLARLGGDEFVVMLEDLSDKDIEAATQAEVVGEKILTTLNQPYQLATHEYQSTASIGVALFSGHKQSHEDLLKHADIAMYQAKKAGRNTLRFFNPQMQTSITARVDLERELRKALEQQQFHLYYQIQVDHLGHPLGAEALIRWLHPERGLVPPFEFIPLAEETGLILPIGQWVLDTACAQLRAWQQDALTRDLTLSINVSAKQFHQADFVDQVQATIQRHAIDPMQLKLELTESLLLENVEDTVVVMTALGEIGVQFSLDDFGTGYSSLQYLKRLPLNQLKIDQSFVRDIAVDSNDQAIVRTIIAMAQSLYLNVIAEGVGTVEQRELLLINGCKRYQGYLFSKPVPIEQFEALLKS